jgi:hypothetical protein
MKHLLMIHKTRQVNMVLKQKQNINIKKEKKKKVRKVGKPKHETAQRDFIPFCMEKRRDL